MSFAKTLRTRSATKNGRVKTYSGETAMALVLQSPLSAQNPLRERALATKVDVHAVMELDAVKRLVPAYQEFREATRTMNQVRIAKACQTGTFLVNELAKLLTPGALLEAKRWAWKVAGGAAEPAI